MNTVYMYIWEFIIALEHASAFEQTYGGAGEWVKLFRRASGYIRTELHRDRAKPERYITIDYWESQEAWEKFRAQFSKDVEALDARCERWTRSEAEIGRFEPVAGDSR